MEHIEKRKKKKSGFRSEETGPKTYNKKSYQDSGNKTLSKATCSTCRSSCTVPFKPNGDKPVYCNDCYQKENSTFTERQPARFKKGAGSNSRDFKPRYNASGVSLEQINDKLDRILKLLM
jgi:CxxC-x17-CxxC domain-containing protein